MSESSRSTERRDSAHPVQYVVGDLAARAEGVGGPDDVAHLVVRNRHCPLRRRPDGVRLLGHPVQRVAGLTKRDSKSARPLTGEPPPQPSPLLIRDVVCEDRLGGLLKHYRWAA